MEGHSKHVVHALRETPNGNSIRRELPGLSINVLRDSNGAVLTGSTTPLIEANSDEVRVKTVAGSTHTIYACLTIPRSYDQSGAGAFAGFLKINMDLYSAGTTDAPAVTLTAKTGNVTSGLSGAFSAGTQTGVASVSRQVLTWDLTSLLDALNSNKIQPGDTITLKFVFGAHTTDDFFIYGVRGFLTDHPNFTNINSRYNSNGDTSST